MKLFATLAILGGLLASPAMAANYDCVSRVIQVNNLSDHEITYLVISGRDSTIWSEDYIPGTLYPGESMLVDGDYAPGSGSGYHMFDLYAESPDGTSWTSYLDLCTLENWNLYN